MSDFSSNAKETLNVIGDEKSVIDNAKNAAVESDGEEDNDIDIDNDNEAETESGVLSF